MATIEGTDAKGVINTPALVITEADLEVVRTVLNAPSTASLEQRFTALGIVDRLVAERDMHKRHVANLNSVFDRMQERGILS